MTGVQHTRRDVLKGLGTMAFATGALSTRALSQTKALPDPARTQLCLVSRHLQWADMEEAVAVAAEAGCRAIAWTVRHGAHIQPENVDRDLPKAVQLANNSGLATPTLITALLDAKSPRAEAILDTMRAVGIRYYRAASFRYDYAVDLRQQLENLKPRVGSLAKLNEKYATTAMYHTHSAPGLVGGGVWDLWYVIKEFDPRFVGLNYDLAHATIRGGTGWVQTSRISQEFVHGLSMKDFRWVKRTIPPNTGPWSPEMVPGGEGMVDFQGMLSYFKSAGFSGPVELYQEYKVTVPGVAEPVNLLGTSYGTWKLEMPKAQYVALLKRDVSFYTNVLREVKLI